MPNSVSFINKFDNFFTILVQSNQPEPEISDKLPSDIKIFKYITDTMAPVTVIFLLTILTILTLIFKEYIKDMFIFIFSVLPIVTGSYLKKLISRPRPDGNVAKIWIKEKSYNFPSTHAAVATSFYGFLGFLVVYYNLSIYLFVACAAMIILISYSRIYLGVHFISDVLAGIILGLINLFVLLQIYSYLPDNFFSIKLLWVLLIISWGFVVKFYRKYPEDIPDFLRLSNTKAKRIYTGLIVFVLAFIPAYIGGILYKFLMGFISVVAVYEILVTKTGNLQKNLLKIVSIPIVIYLVLSIIFLRDMPGGRSYTLIFIFSTVLTDVLAYFIGSKYGKIKIFGSISPNKTLEGALGGFFLTVLIIGTILFRHISSSYEIIAYLSISAVLGDLIESLFKRQLQIKDFSNFLPGHGGILDRVDSSLFTGFITYILATCHILILIK